MIDNHSWTKGQSVILPKETSPRASELLGWRGIRSPLSGAGSPTWRPGQASPAPDCPIPVSEQLPILRMPASPGSAGTLFCCGDGIHVRLPHCRTTVQRKEYSLIGDQCAIYIHVYMCVHDVHVPGSLSFPLMLSGLQVATWRRAWPFHLNIKHSNGSSIHAFKLNT
jgi:hypothetical protein